MTLGARKIVRPVALLLVRLFSPSLRAGAPSDMLNAELWMRAVEFRANCLTVFTLRSLAFVGKAFARFGVRRQLVEPARVRSSAAGCSH